MAKTLKEVFMEEAASGVMEYDGRDAHPRILEYFGTTTIKATDDATPWCSAMMNWAVQQLGMTGTDSAASASWEKWGEGLKKPADGCIIGFVRQDGSGHVGIYVGEDEYNYKILGGNQANTVKISNFAKTNTDETRRWYFRKPKTLLNSATIGGGIVVAGGATGIIVDGVSNKIETTEVPSTANENNTITANTIGIDSGMINAVVALITAVVIIYERIKKIRNVGI